MTRRRIFRRKAEATESPINTDPPIKGLVASAFRRKIACLLLIALSVTACGRARLEGDVIVVGMTNPVVNLDPRVGSDEASQKAHQLLYNSLVRIDTDLRIVPELAESLEQPDTSTYIVRLRRGVLFHDGNELTAADVVHTFRGFLDPAFRGRSAAYRQQLAAVDAIDRYTVQFTLKGRFVSFLINLVMGIVRDGSGAANARQPNGTGPYRVVTFVPDDRLVLAAFDRHYAGSPRTPSLVLKVIPDDTMRGRELRNRTIDLVVNDLSPDIVWQLQEGGRYGVETSPGTDYAYIGLNLRDPVLSHIDVRKAIGFAIDREAIVKYLRRGLATTAQGIVPPMSWAFERNVFDFKYDPAEAKRLLDAAGFPDPDGDGPAVRFHLSFRTSTSEVYRIQAAAIQQDLSRVGIAVDVRSTELQTLRDFVARGNYQMYSLQWVGVTDPDMLRLVYHSSQMPPVGLNRVYYRNPEVDGAIEQASSAADPTARREYYARAQQIIAEDVPYIGLWYRTNVAVFQSNIRGVKLSPTADFTFLRNVVRETTRSAAER